MDALILKSPVLFSQQIIHMILLLIHSVWNLLKDQNFRWGTKFKVKFAQNIEAKT